MHTDEQGRIATATVNTNQEVDAPKRRGRPAVSKEVQTLPVNLSGTAVARMEALTAHANKQIAAIGVVAEADAGKMLDHWVEQMINEKYREAFPKAFGKK